MRTRADLKDVLDAEEFFRPRMMVAIVQGMENLQQKVSIDDIARAIAAGTAREIVTVDQSQAALSVAATVVKNVVGHGAGIGRKKLKKAMKK